MISIPFEITKDEYSFKDAIVLPDDHQLSDADIENIKQKRFDDWYAVVTAPQEEQPTQEI